jgi:NADH:ubiquinone oxidoreductase subunit 5 (subunit L)/multisubunit Na+/H+ antiporter MnhA subunit
MEGPTPVSALLHAATMVTAGVFILIRFALLLDCVPIMILLIGFIGTLTSVFAGLSACVQFDIKKIIAYSTCSHLGIMLCLCGLSHFHVAIFHLFNHAFFKALLFLSAGAIIHALRNEQDIRKMGGLVSILPFTYCMFFIGSLSAIGFPFLSGFFSKDLGWELIFTRLFLVINEGPGLGFYGPTFFYYYAIYTFIVFNLILILSVLYSFRLIFIVFSSSFNGFRIDIRNAHEPTLFMLIPLIILSFFSIFAGFLFKDIFVGLGNPIWFQTLPDSVLNYDLNAFKEVLFMPEILN